MDNTEGFGAELGHFLAYRKDTQPTELTAIHDPEVHLAKFGINVACGDSTEMIVELKKNYDDCQQLIDRKQEYY